VPVIRVFAKAAAMVGVPVMAPVLEFSG